MTADLATTPTVTSANALELEDLHVDYKVRGNWKQVLRGVSLTIAPGESFGLVGESGCGKSTAAFAALKYLPRNGRVSSGSIRVAGEDLLAMSDAAVRKLPRHPGVDGVPEPDVGAEPDDPHRRSGGRGVHAAGHRRRRGDRAGAGDAHEGADLRSDAGDGPLPAPAVGWDEPARRDRHGARQGSDAVDPRRADDGSRRDGRGRGPRSGCRAAPGVRHERAVHQPQPRRDPAHVRPRRSAVRRSPRRGRCRRGGVPQPAPSVHRRAAALHPPRRGT